MNHNTMFKDLPEGQTHDDGCTPPQEKSEWENAVEAAVKQLTMYGGWIDEAQTARIATNATNLFNAEYEKLIYIITSAIANAISY